MRGPAGELHAVSAAAVDPAAGPARRALRVLEATAPALVLGSGQPAATVDAGRLAQRGWELARRRSGGGGVVVGPGEVVWVDVVVPAGDPALPADLHRAAWWLGGRWAAALVAAGCTDVAVWRGPLVATELSPLVCFAGLGPGEVTVGGRKAVGVSQRRTRAGVLLQSALLVRWAPAELLDVLAVPAARAPGAAGRLAGAAVGVGGAVAAAALAGLEAGLAAGGWAGAAGRPGAIIDP